MTCFLSLLFFVLYMGVHADSIFRICIQIHIENRECEVERDHRQYVRLLMFVELYCKCYTKAFDALPYYFTFVQVPRIINEPRFGYLIGTLMSCLSKQTN